MLKLCIEGQEGKEKAIVLCSRPPQNVKLGIFTLFVVVQWRQRNVQKRVICFAKGWIHLQHTRTELSHLHDRWNFLLFLGRHGGHVGSQEKTHFPPEPCSQGSLLPALRMAGRREPWERGCSLELNSIFV